MNNRQQFLGKACTAAIYVLASMVLASGQTGINPNQYDKLNADEYLAEFEHEHYETLATELKKIRNTHGWEEQGPAD